MTTLGFTVSLSAVSGQAVTVGYATADGTATTADGDYLAASGADSCPCRDGPAGERDRERDTKNEVNETLVVNLSAPVNATISDSQGLGTITNDDLATYLLSVSTPGSSSGKVTSSPSGCGSDCSESYTAGTIVTLMAEPGPTSTFEGWSGGSCSATAGGHTSVYPAGTPRPEASTRLRGRPDPRQQRDREPRGGRRPGVLLGPGLGQRLRRQRLLRVRAASSLDQRGSRPPCEETGLMP